MMDIDHFKLYNDSYGHQEGESCLQLVAGAIREQLKRGQDRVARYGGEEFVCLLPQTNAQAAQLIGEKILAAVQALAIPHAASLTAETVSISAGGACDAQFTGQSPAGLLKRADDSLCQAKKQGRNRLIFHGC